jgi:F-box domain
MERRLKKFIRFCSRQFQTYEPEPVSQDGFEFTTMPSIPIDVLREILEHVRKADLATLCRVNKIFCSCSRDVLYREIDYEVAQAIQTLAQSTDLARRVRSFKTTHSPPELATALRNMSSLHSLGLDVIGDMSILDGCTFKLDSFSCFFPYSESFQQFLNNQQSLTDIAIWSDYEPVTPFDERCLPNLTRVWAPPSWLGILIPGRPVREVNTISSSSTHSTDWSFFTLSTTPILVLTSDYNLLYPKPVSLLVSTFPSLVYLDVIAREMKWTVRTFTFVFLIVKY